MRKTTKLMLVVLLLVGVSGMASGATLETRYEFDGDLLNSVSGAPDGSALNKTYVTGYDGSSASAIRFDGTANTTVTTTTGGHPIAGAGVEVGSIAFWLKQDAGTPVQATAITGTLNTTQGFMLESDRSDDRWRLFIRDGNGHVFQVVNRSETGDIWRDGEWHHHVWTWDITAKTCTNYVDGVLRSTTIDFSHDMDAFVAWDNSTVISGYNNRGAPKNFLTGDMDDYRVYSDILTQSDVDVLAINPLEAVLVSPEEGEVDVTLATNLVWQAAEDPENPGQPNPNVTAHKVYFGTDSANLPLVVTLPVGTTEYNPTMVKDEHYYWRIDEVIDPNDYPSEVWDFYTELSLPVITEQPVDNRLPLGSTAIFTVSATDPLSGVLSYQWYRDTTQVGTDSDTLTIDPIGAGDYDDYHCDITNISGTVSSDTVALSEGKLVAHYKLNDASGNTAIDEFGNNGSINGTATWTTGIDSGALDFDGSENYIDISTSGLPDPCSADGVSQGSIVFWINRTSAAFQNIMGTTNDGSNAAIQLRVGDANGPDSVDDELRFYMRPDGAAVAVTLGVDAAGITFGQWHQCAVTWHLDNTSENAVYIDGEKREFVAYSDNFTSDDAISGWDYPVVLGAVNNRGSIGTFFDGDLDDYRVYNYSLTPVEVAVLYVTFRPGESVCAEPPYMDFSGNCRVDLADFALFAEAWLQCGLVPDCLP